VRAAESRSRGLGQSTAPAMTMAITTRTTKMPTATTSSASRPSASETSTPEPTAPATISQHAGGDNSAEIRLDPDRPNRFRRFGFLGA
jgi:hypothetical protein